MSKILVWFVYPLSLGIFILITGYILSRFKKNNSMHAAFLSGIAILYVFSIRPTAELLLQPLESKYCCDKQSVGNAEVIVVLSGDNLGRIIKAVKLFYENKAPLLVVSGRDGNLFGRPSRKKTSLMKKIAIQLGVPEEKTIAEARSRNTRENALYTKQILDNRKIENVILVTSAYHMPRAHGVFEKIGINAVPAPSDFFISKASYTPFHFIPNAKYLLRSTVAIKEYVGFVVYWLKGWI